MNRSFLAALCMGLAAALLAGCGGSQIGATVPQSATLQTQRAHRDALLYVSYANEEKTDVFTYPAGAFVGSLTAGTGVPCADAHGDVFIPDQQANKIYQYSYGGTSPIATLTVPGSHPSSCAYDRTSGDLAVTFDCGTGCGSAAAIFTNEQGTPVTYSFDATFTDCTYDASGNLFIVGYEGSNTRYVLELPQGGSQLASLSFDQSIVADSVRWDGKYIVLQGRQIGGAKNSLFRARVSGSSVTVTGAKVLDGVTSLQHAAIEKSSVVAPVKMQGVNHDIVGYWSYPQGGDLSKVVRKPFRKSDSLLGATIAVAP